MQGAQASTLAPCPFQVDQETHQISFSGDGEMVIAESWEGKREYFGVVFLNQVNADEVSCTGSILAFHSTIKRIEAQHLWCLGTQFDRALVSGTTILQASKDFVDNRKANGALALFGEIKIPKTESSEEAEIIRITPELGGFPLFANDPKKSGDLVFTKV